MALLKIAYRNLARRKRRTALLFTLIATILALIVLADAVFAATGKGLERSFKGSLTADLAVGAAVKGPVSLFGDETPIVSEYAAIPIIPDFDRVRAAIEAVPGVGVVAPQVTAAAAFQVAGGAAIKAFAFGVAPAEYARVCPDIVFDGALPRPDRPFILLNAALRSSIEAGLGRPLAAEERITLTVATGTGSFRIRSAPFEGAFSYVAPNEALDRVALVDPETARYLDGYSLGYTDASAVPAPAGDPLAGIFDEASAVIDASGGSVGLEDVEKAVREGSGRKLMAGSALDWNFLLVRLDPGADADAVRRAVESLPGGADIRVLSWGEAAGFAAQGISVVMAIFYLGVAIIAVGALAIAMNSLAISVNERMSEIGGMRAIGATRGFVNRLFTLEVLILVSAAAFAGILLGGVAAAIAGSSGLNLGNGVLASIFGGSTLRVELDLSGLVLHFLGAIAAGLLVLPFPLRAAMRADPARIMGGGER